MTGTLSTLSTLSAVPGVNLLPTDPTTLSPTLFGSSSEEFPEPVVSPSSVPGGHGMELPIPEIANGTGRPEVSQSTSPKLYMKGKIALFIVIFNII